MAKGKVAISFRFSDTALRIRAMVEALAILTTFNHFAYAAVVRRGIVALTEAGSL